MDFEEWLKNKGLADSTIGMYIASMDLYLRDWTIEEQREWKSIESKRISPNTLNTRIFALRSYCEFIGEPCSVKPVSIVLPEYIDDVLTKAQYQRLLDGLERDEKRDYWCIVKLLGMTA